MKSSTPELLKFQKLMRRLKESRRGTIGLLEGMWLAVGKNCPRGDIGRFSNEEIAIMVDWDGDPDELVSALVECRWLDVCDTYRLVVHDWTDHCPTYIKGGLVKKGEDIAIATSYEVQAKVPPKVQAKVPPGPTSGTTLGNSYEVPSTKPSLVKSSQAKPNLSDSSELLQASKPVDSTLVFELVGKDSGPWSPPLSLIAQFESWYPSMDVDSELRKAAAWHATNPTKRKTKNGIAKFLNAWLAKANDRGTNGQPQKQLTLSDRLASIRMEDYQQ